MDATSSRRASSRARRITPYGFEKFEASNGAIWMAHEKCQRFKFIDREAQYGTDLSDIRVVVDGQNLIDTSSRAIAGFEGLGNRHESVS